MPATNFESREDLSPVEGGDSTFAHNPVLIRTGHLRRRGGGGRIALMVGIPLAILALAAAGIVYYGKRTAAENGPAVTSTETSSVATGLAPPVGPVVNPVTPAAPPPAVAQAPVAPPVAQPVNPPPRQLARATPPMRHTVAARRTTARAPSVETSSADVSATAPATPPVIAAPPPPPSTTP